MYGLPILPQGNPDTAENLTQDPEVERIMLAAYAAGHVEQDELLREKVCARRVSVSLTCCTSKPKSYALTSFHPRLRITVPS